MKLWERYWPPCQYRDGRASTPNFQPPTPKALPTSNSQLPISNLQGTPNSQLPNSQVLRLPMTIARGSALVTVGRWVLGVPWKLAVGSWKLRADSDKWT